MGRQTYKFLLAVIILTALVYSAAFLHGIFKPEIRMLPDSFEYLTAADNMKEHGTFYAGSLKNKIDYVLYSRRPPGYPFLLFILSLASPSLALPVIFQVFLTFSGGILLWHLNNELKIPPLLNVSALGVYLLHPCQIIYSQMIMAETVLQFLLLASAFFLILFLKRKSWIFIVLLNICLGMAVLCKPVMLYFWVPNLFLHILLFRKTSRKVILAASLIPILFISLWSWRNYQVTGVYHFSSLKASHIRFSIPGAADTFESTSKEDFSKTLSNADELTSKILLSPQAMSGKLLYMSINMTAFFLDPGRFDAYRFIPLKGENISTSTFLNPDEEWNSYFRNISAPVLIYLGLLLLINLIIILAFIPFPFMADNDPYLRLYILLVVLYMSSVVAMAAMGTARYRLAVEPLLIAGAAAATASAWRRLRNRVDKSIQ